MSWTTLYRQSLRMLPTELRHKHADAMTAMFEREVARARLRGRFSEFAVATRGLYDVLHRGAYETMRTDTSSNSALLRKQALAFLLSFVVLTACLVANYASTQLPGLTARGATSTTLMKAALLAVPFTAALTIPMAVFIAVLWVFTQRARKGEQEALAVRDSRAVRRLLAPVFKASLVIAALMLVLTSQIVPRANEQLTTLITGREVQQRSDRMKTIGELRYDARSSSAVRAPDAATMTATTNVEIQKKYALSAACVVFALLGAACGLRFPCGGTAFVISASLAVFGSYYVAITFGESLAEQLVVSPFVGMWGANIVFLGAALLLLWRRPTHVGNAPSVELAEPIG